MEGLVPANHVLIAAAERLMTPPNDVDGRHNKSGHDVEKPREFVMRLWDLHGPLAGGLREAQGEGGATRTDVLMHPHPRRDFSRGAGEGYSIGGPLKRNRYRPAASCSFACAKVSIPVEPSPTDRTIRTDAMSLILRHTSPRGSGSVRRSRSVVANSYQSKPRHHRVRQHV
jgi:hypothetical protein